MRQSDQPFTQTMTRLLAEHEVSGREVSRLCLAKYEWGARGTIGHLIAGNLKPSMNSMKCIAGALGERPEVFAEYRLGAARQALDPDEVGFKEALRNLAVIEQAEGAEPTPHSPKDSVQGRRQGGGGGRAASS